MNSGKPEILAPAGSMETLIAALRSGADAVYVGGKKFSARSSAANFTIEELAEAADKCHLYNAKLYLAVNTIISDNEADEFCEYIKSAASAGIDAFIVQDLGAALIIRRCISNAVLHASTQMSIHTARGALLLKKLGFARVVPAREINKSIIEKICRTGIETEIFVHGALCMSVSGQCFMSAVIGSRSANRGCCGQACRLPFSACENRSHAALSLKDLSLIPKVSELKEIGVDSLKIEGRMKRPEYTASAVNALRRALNDCTPDMQQLRGIFSRGGFTDGYFTDKRSDMFGVREKDDVIAAKTLIPKIHELYRFERKIRIVDFHAIIKSEQPVRITAVCGEYEEAVESDLPESAHSKATDLSALEKQLSRLGDTVFTLGRVTAEIDDGLFISSGKINELRRILIGKLSRKIISELHPKYNINSDYHPYLYKRPEASNSKMTAVRTFCRTIEQINAALPLSEFIIAPHTLLLVNDFNGTAKQRIIVSPPRFIVDEEKTVNELKELRRCGFSHLLCHTLDSISVGAELGFTLHGSFGLNIYNSLSAEAMRKLLLSDIMVSFESKIPQISSLYSNIPVGAVVYGRLPLMLTRNCPIKNEIGCAECKGFIADRTGRKFPVECSKDYVEILNADNLYMFDKPELTGAVDFCVVILSNENFEQTKAAVKGKKPSDSITRGLYYRGI